MCGLFGAKRLTSLAGIFFQPSLGACLQATVLLASYMYADVLWAGHTIFLPTNNVLRGARLRDRPKERLRWRLTVLLIVIHLPRKCSEMNSIFPSERRFV